MKKGLRKLILSGTALAAVAATLGTSTYAWYTTNPTVSANSIQAGSSDTGSSSIFISKDSASTKNWSSSVTLTSADFVTANPSLVPLSYASNGQFKSIVPATGALDANASNPGSSVAQVTLYFKSSKVADNNAQSIYVKSVSVLNTTADADANTDGRQMPTADNLLYLQKNPSTQADYIASEVGVTSAQATYSVDFRDALSMAIYNAAATNGYSNAFSLAGCKTNNSTYTAPTGVLSTGKAQEYYDAVMEHDLVNESKAAAPAIADATNGIKATAIGVCPTNGTDYITVNFYIYLDGASQFCYDACQGQQFSIDLQFTSDVTAAIGYVAPNNG